jgi:hypothetical protein
MSATASNFSWGKAIVAGIVGAVVAAIVAGLYGLIINSTVGPALAPIPPADTAPNPVGAINYLIFTLIFYVPGVIIWAVTLRYSGPNGIRNYVIIAAVGLLLSFATVARPGFANNGQIILGIAHVVAVIGVPVMIYWYRR